MIAYLSEYPSIDKESSADSPGHAALKPQLKKKKLLIITTVSSTFENNLVSQPSFLSSRYDVRICSSPSSGLESFAKKEEVKFYSIEMYRGINLLKDIKSIFLFYKVLKVFKPDIVHSYTPKAGLVNATSSIFRRKQISIHTFTGLVFLGEQGLKRKLLIWIDKLIASLVSEVVPEGEGVRKDLAQFKITFNPAPVLWHGNINGVDLKRFNPTVRALRRKKKIQIISGISPTARVFSFVGRINQHKGFEELIKAFCNLQLKFPEIHLIVAGRVEDKNPVSQQTLETLENHRNIHYHGFTKEIEQLLSIADVNVLPSYREGMPNVVLQSAALGIPSIVTAIHGCADIVDDKVNGWLVKVKNVQALEEKMQEIIVMENSEIRRVGERAAKLVSTKFNRKDVQKSLSEYYFRLLTQYQNS